MEEVQSTNECYIVKYMNMNEFYTNKYVVNWWKKRKKWKREPHGISMRD